MNEIPKAVFSRKGLESSTVTRAVADAAAAREARGEKPSATSASSATTWTQAPVFSDLVTEITRLKQEPGKEILAHGGASFAQSLVTSGLIDEYRLLVHPVALGRGLPLFAGLPKPVSLRLLSAIAFSAGVVAHVYRPA